MSADILRKAAEKMRERAEAATHGPWESVDRSDYGYPFVRRASSSPRMAYPAHAQVNGTRSYDPAESLAEALGDAEHIASWHPAVALAVADLLNEVADRLDRYGYEPGDKVNPTYAAAFAVARAYLGESA